MLDDFGQKLYTNIIKADRWKLYFEGMGLTLEIAVGAIVLGIVLGALVAVVKVKAKEVKALQPLEWLCDIYLTVIRGTPVMLQVLICYFVIFASAPTSLNVLIAIITFGVNSGAYVAEIFRAGILAVDIGQTEAGRSLGLTSNQTMTKIVLPQAVKNILPALGNELIVLVKETAVAGTVGVVELTKIAQMISTRTYNALVPLCMAALLYLCLVLIMSFFLRKFERRLAKSER